ncbi:MAG: hypothetical protein WCF04_09350, partial [Candidatus Nanopelagicales bacterium]
MTVDVGGSGIKYAVADESYALSSAGTLPTQYDNHASFVEAVGSIYDGVADDVVGIAMSCCGELDPGTGH